MQFCGRRDAMCEQLVCHLGNLEAGREASIHMEVKLNPHVLLQAPVKHADNSFFFKSGLTKKMSDVCKDAVISHNSAFLKLETKGMI